MPCHGVPWHHPLGTSSSTMFWKQSFWLPLPFLLPRWGTLNDGWEELGMKVFKPCKSCSPHRDRLTLKMSASSVVRVLTGVWQLLLPHFPLPSFLLTALRHNGQLTAPQTHEIGLPWWRSGYESACQCRGHRFEPWSGEIPHAAEQLSPRATTTEPALYSPRATTTEARVPRAHALQQEKPLQWEARAPQWRVAPARHN